MKNSSDNQSTKQKYYVKNLCMKFKDHFLKQLISVGKKEQWKDNTKYTFYIIINSNKYYWILTFNILGKENKK